MPGFENQARRPMHETTMQYLKPSTTQMNQMTLARDAATAYMRALEELLPEGPDKTYVIRKHREVAMWANIAITRNADGSPRE